MKWLVDRSGGAQAVARAMGSMSFQSTLHRFASGQVDTPNRASAERIAKHFGIPLEACYDPQAAQITYDRLTKAPQPTQPNDANCVADLAAMLAPLPPSTRAACGALLAALANNPGEALSIAAQINALLAVASTKRLDGTNH